jgi:hypothetical protein
MPVAYGGVSSGPVIVDDLTGLGLNRSDVQAALDYFNGSRPTWVQSVAARDWSTYYQAGTPEVPAAPPPHVPAQQAFQQAMQIIQDEHDPRAYSYRSFFDSNFSKPKKHRASVTPLPLP